MGLVSGRKSIQKLISRSEGIVGKSLGKTYGNYLTMGTNSKGGFLESNSSTLTILYKHPFGIQALIKEIIRPLRIEFSQFHSKMGSFGKLNCTILVLHSIEYKKNDATNTSPK